MEKMIMVAMMILAATAVWGAEWQYLEDDYYIDTASITVKPDNVLQYWIKTIPKTNEFKKTLKLAGIDYKEFSHALYENEINCNNKESRITGEYFYSKDKDILYSGIYKKSSFEPILPGSKGEREYLSLCNSPVSKK